MNSTCLWVKINTAPQFNHYFFETIFHKFNKQKNESTLSVTMAQMNQFFLLLDFNFKSYLVFDIH